MSFANFKIMDPFEIEIHQDWTARPKSQKHYGARKQNDAVYILLTLECEGIALHATIWYFNSSDPFSLGFPTCIILDSLARPMKIQYENQRINQDKRKACFNGFYRYECWGKWADSVPINLVSRMQRCEISSPTRMCPYTQILRVRDGRMRLNEKMENSNESKPNHCNG